uniref:RsmE family RNA methyltransferase n=1 Tax=Agathobacter sp. TaxID=2021311 RepID=UPI0040562B6C
MYQFFVEPYQVGPEYISILGNDVNHIKNVLRMKTGTRIRVSTKKNTKKEIGQSIEDEKADSFFGIIEQILDKEVIVKIESQDENGTELANRIYLFQGLPKGDKMELIIQKAVELGIYQVIPVAMKNCVVKLDDKKAAGKVKRWQAISESAAKQSKRTVIPEIKMPLSWKLARKEAENLDVVLVPYENERGMEATREVLQSIKPGQSIGIFVGPEGGFSPDEIDGIAPVQTPNEINGSGSMQTSNENIASMQISQGMNLEAKTEVIESEFVAKKTIYHRISLGRRILRTETAGLATLSMLVFCLDE